VLTNRNILCAVVAACALAAGGCGGNDNSNGGATQPPPPGNGADRAFINAVIPLHEKAVAISVIGQTKGNKFVKDISLKIAGVQPQETARLRSIGSALFAAGVPLGTLGVPKTTAANVDLKALRQSTGFNTAFLKAMIPIHEATIALCGAELKKGDQVDLKTTSQAMLDTEKAQLASMRKRLQA
jgi:uncharacterized protein (DUF305 family)